jgi:hypothetical protein
LSPEREPSVVSLAHIARLKPLLTAKHRRVALESSRLDYSAGHLDVCVDLKAWRAHGWKRTAEPAGMTVQSRYLKVLGEDRDLMTSVRFSSHQRATLTALQKRVFDHEMKINNPIFRVAGKWLLTHGLL